MARVKAPVLNNCPGNEKACNCCGRFALSASDASPSSEKLRDSATCRTFGIRSAAASSDVFLAGNSGKLVHQILTSFRRSFRLLCSCARAVFLTHSAPLHDDDRTQNVRSPSCWGPGISNPRCVVDEKVVAALAAERGGSADGPPVFFKPKPAGCATDIIKKVIV